MFRALLASFGVLCEVAEPLDPHASSERLDDRIIERSAPAAPSRRCKTRVCDFGLKILEDARRVQHAGDARGLLAARLDAERLAVPRPRGVPSSRPAACAGRSAACPSVALRQHHIPRRTFDL
jgi:hypothetical protein